MATNGLDNENGQNPNCPSGSPAFNASPPNALDRAFALANLGYQQSRQATAGIQNAGVGCGGNVEVNLGNGNLIARWNPPGTGTMDPRPALVYNSQSGDSTEFGFGWTNMLRQRVSQVSTANQVAVIKGSGKVLQYTNKDGNGNFQPPDDTNNTLRTFQEGGNNVWLETQPNGFQLKYDSSGKLAWMQNAQQARWTLSYTGATSLIQNIKNPSGQLTTLAYDGTPLLKSITDVGGRVTSFSFTGTDLTQITTPELCQLNLGYDGSHNLTSIAAAGGQRITYAYDGSDRLSQVTWPNIGLSTYAYGLGLFSQYNVVTDPRGQMTTLTGTSPQTFSTTNPVGQITTLVSTSSRLTSVADARGFLTTFSYSGASTTAPSLLSTVQLPRGGVFTYHYDTSNRINWVIDPDGNYSTVIWDATVTYQRNALVDALNGRTTYSYNTAGQMTAIQDPLGNLATRIYDGLGNLSALVDALGNTTTYGYNTANVLVATQDPLGKVTTLTRDQMNRVIASQDPLGNITTTSYNSNGQVLTIQDPLGNVTSSVYDGTTGQLAANLDPLGNRTTFGYDLAGRQITAKDPLGNVTTTTYDNANRVTGSIDPLGDQTIFGYDLAGNRITVQDPLGFVTTTAYDGDGTVQAVTDATGNTTTTVYDAFDQPTVKIDPLGFRTTYTIDALLRPIEMRDPLGNRTTTVYDAASRPIATLDPKNNRTTTQYDAASWPVARIDALGNTTTTVYDAKNQPIATLDPLGNLTTTQYDSDGRPLVLTDPLGNTVTFGYDAVGNRRTVTDPFGNVATTSYDARRLPIATMDPLGNTTTTVYDALGRTIATQDPLGNRTSTVYDNAGRELASVDALGFITSMGRDQAGQLTAILDARGNFNVFQYDGAGRPTVLQVPGTNQFFITTYDAKGRVATRWNTIPLPPNVPLVTFSYDALDRPTLRTRPDGVLISFSYDSLGNRLTMADETGTTTYAYDALNRRTAMQNPAGLMVTYAYDSRSQRSLMQEPGGGRFTYVYDAAGRITTLTNPDSRRTTFIYDRTRRKGLIHGNGALVTYLYDAAGQMTGIDNRNLFKSTFARYTYTFDAAGNRASVVEKDGSRVTWTYDASYQLTNERRNAPAAIAFNATHTFDAVGNRTVWNETSAGARSYSFAFDGANQAATDSASETYQYDGSGNLASVAWPGLHTVPSFAYSLTWDAEDRLKTYYDAPGGGGLPETYTYDGDGRRVRRIDAAGNVRNYLWDFENVLLETDGSGVRQCLYTLEPALYGNLVSENRYEGTGQRFYHFDGLGSTVALTITTTSTPSPWHYQAFGKPLEGGDLFTPYRWLGQIGYQLQFIPGLLGSGYVEGTFDFANYWVRDRWYDLWTGRWTGRDIIPVGPRNPNPYVNVDNNPVNWVDPSGNTRGGKQNVRPTEIPSNWTESQIENYLQQLLGMGVDPNSPRVKAIRGWLKVIKRIDKFNKFVSSKARKLNLVGCLGKCASDYNACLDSAQGYFERALDRAQYFSSAQQAESYVDNYYYLWELDAAECAIVYAACSLRCLCPF